MNLALAKNEMLSVRRALTWLRDQTESDACILCDSAGNVLDLEGKEPHNSALVTALAAGVYGASRELARMLGQEEFESVLNQGETTNIFFQSVTEDLLLVTVFSETASTGLVKLHADRAATLMRETLTRPQRAEEMAGEALPALEFTDDDNMFGAATEQTEQHGLRQKRRTVGQV